MTAVFAFPRRRFTVLQYERSVVILVRTGTSALLIHRTALRGT